MLASHWCSDDHSVHADAVKHIHTCTEGMNVVEFVHSMSQLGRSKFEEGARRETCSVKCGDTGWECTQDTPQPGEGCGCVNVVCCAVRKQTGDGGVVW